MQTKGINHLALVCRDMAETVRVLHRGAGHAAGEDRGPAGRRPALLLRLRRRLAAGLLLVAGRAAGRAGHRLGEGLSRPSRKSAVGSMNHVAFDMDEDQLEASIAQLQAAGVHVSVPVVVNHDDSPMGVAREMHEGVWVRSVYFRDPNGIMLEFAATLRGFRPDDMRPRAGPRAVEPAGA